VFSILIFSLHSLIIFIESYFNPQKQVSKKHFLFFFTRNNIGTSKNDRKHRQMITISSICRMPSIFKAVLFYFCVGQNRGVCGVLLFRKKTGVFNLFARAGKEEQEVADDWFTSAIKSALHAVGQSSTVKELAGPATELCRRGHFGSLLNLYRAENWDESWHRFCEFCQNEEVRNFLKEKDTSQVLADLMLEKASETLADERTDDHDFLKLLKQKKKLTEWISGDELFKEWVANVAIPDVIEYAGNPNKNKHLFVSHDATRRASPMPTSFSVANILEEELLQKAYTTIAEYKSGDPHKQKIIEILKKFSAKWITSPTHNQTFREWTSSVVRKLISFAQEDTVEAAGQSVMNRSEQRV
jgi:hypothetical protein